MSKHKLKKEFFILIGLILSIALLSGCTLFNQKPITISQINNLSLKVDEVKEITVMATPNDVSINAVSNDPSIATVTANKNVLTIKGKAGGEAEITITATKSGYKTASLKFKIIVGSLPNITSVSSLSDIEVVYGTPFLKIGLPETVQVTLDDQTKQTLEVAWSQGNYDGNSSGTYTLEGKLTLVEGITNISDVKAKIKVLVPVEVLGDIINVEQLDPKKVPHGRELGDIGLPQEVKVTLDKGSERYLAVEWISDNFDGDLAGEVYTIEGSLVLYEGITNPNNLIATIDIVVNNPPIITSLTTEEGTYRKYESVSFLLVADDADGDELTYRWKDNEEEFYPLDSKDFSHSFSDIGTHEVVVQVSDGINEVEEKRTFVVNAYPEITSLTTSETVIKINEEITLDVVAVDHEDEQLTYRWSEKYKPIEGEESSSLTWKSTELGKHQIYVYVSDDGGESEVDAYVEIEVVDNYIPEIEKITGPEYVLVNQEGLVFTAEYDHRDTTKELTVHWETDAGTIVEGQYSEKVKWNAPADTGTYCLTFVVNDGDTEVSKDIDVLVKKPDISIYFNDTIGAGQLCELFVYVFVGFDADMDINIEVTPSDGEIISSLKSSWTASFHWKAPKELGIVTFDIKVTIDGVEFYDDRTIHVVENNTPIVNHVLVNNEPINPEEFLILNPNEEYNFEIDVFDPDEDSLDIDWGFYKLSGDYDSTYFKGNQANYSSNERSVVTCQIQIGDGINAPVYTSINMIFDDGSVSDFPDQTKVQKIEEIIEAFNQTFEQNNIDFIVDHLHPDAGSYLRPIFEEYLDNQMALYVIERDFIVFDSFINRYTTFTLMYAFKDHDINMCTIMGMIFEEDENGVIKLYDLDS